MATGAARATRSTGSATCWAQARNTSRLGSASGSSAPGQPTNATSLSKSPGTASNNCAPATTMPATAKDKRSPPRSSPRSRAARSRKSRASAGRYVPGSASSWATSTPAARTTSAPRPSTASSSSPTHRPRLTQPRQLPLAHAAHRRRTIRMTHIRRRRTEADMLPA